jgi:hypothetical protein
MVVTPSDLRDILGVTDGSRWLSLVRWAPALEPQVRGALETIFEPQRTRRFTGDRAGLSAYLESVTEPLAFLRDGGTVIMVVVAPSAAIGIHVPFLAPDWAIYLVGVEGMYLRFDDHESGLPVVHRLEPQCEALLRSIVAATRAGSPIVTWESRADVAANLGAAVPWCTCCCLAEAAGTASEPET